MKQKLKQLARWCFVLALAIFAFTYVFFHFITPEGRLSLVWQAQCGKPFVAHLFGIWGCFFLFSGVMSLLVGHIFYAGSDHHKE